MSTNAGYLIHRVASNYLIFLANFPPALKPNHLAVPEGEQAALFDGLHHVHNIIEAVYRYFTEIPLTSGIPDGWNKHDSCRRTIEGPIKLLWAIGVAGQLVPGAVEQQLVVKRADLNMALMSRNLKFSPTEFTVLERLGLRIACYDGDSEPLPRAHKKVAIITVAYPAANESFLRALIEFARHFMVMKKSLPFEIFLRASPTRS